LNAEEKKRQEELTKVYQLKKLAKSVPIPTNDKEVKMRLRELGVPLCLFGETNIDRRERLKKQLTSKIIQEGKLPVFRKIEEKKVEKVKDNEVFYSEGKDNLTK
jgi:U4/U6 small nuclear ribonucleoprotein PRP4